MLIVQTIFAVLEWPDQGPICLSQAKGDKLDLRYRIYIHRGDEKEGKIEQKWQDWVNPPVDLSKVINIEKAHLPQI